MNLIGSPSSRWMATTMPPLLVPSSLVMTRPVSFTVYARETGTLRRQITELVNQYRRYKPDIELRFVNPDADPERVRQLGVSVDGELHIVYAGRNTKVQSLSEQTLSNALQRVARSDQHWVAFLSGPGERTPPAAGISTTRRTRQRSANSKKESGIRTHDERFFASRSGLGLRPNRLHSPALPSLSNLVGLDRRIEHLLHQSRFVPFGASFHAPPRYLRPGPTP